MVGFKDGCKFEFPEPLEHDVKIKDILEEDVDEKYYLSQQYLNSLRNHRERHEKKGHGFGFEILDINSVANTIVVGGMGKERNLIRDNITYDYWKQGDDPLKKKNDDGVRKMTEREWARLQGFPDDFEFPVSMTQSYKQLANSVPVNVIRSIAQAIKDSLDNA